MYSLGAKLGVRLTSLVFYLSSSADGGMVIRLLLSAHWPYERGKTTTIIESASIRWL